MPEQTLQYNPFGYPLMVPKPSIEGYEVVVRMLMQGAIAPLITQYGPEEFLAMTAPVHRPAIILFAVDMMNTVLADGSYGLSLVDGPSIETILFEVMEEFRTIAYGILHPPPPEPSE